jgi:alpha-beta hydrolase superfamily lysophospholipase
LSVLVLLVLAACAPRLAQEGSIMERPAIAPAAPSVVMAPDTAAHGTGDRYITRDGLALGLMHWDATSADAVPKAIVVALHGMNDYSNAFAMPAPWWAARGITLYAYDQRGFGRSPQTGIWPGAELMCRDLADFVDVVRARHPGIPVFVLGESMGGAVAMTAFASPAPPHADGLILVAPAIWSRAAMPLSYRVALWATAHTLRWWSLTGAGLHILPSDNFPMLRALSRDPLVIKGTRADAIAGLVTLMDDAYESPRRLTRIPLLLAYGGNDQIIPKKPTEAVIAKLGPNATVKFYPKGYHMLLRDLDGPARWADIANWILAQAAKHGAMMVSLR